MKVHQIPCDSEPYAFICMWPCFVLEHNRSFSVCHNVSSVSLLASSLENVKENRILLFENHWSVRKDFKFYCKQKTQSFKIIKAGKSDQLEKRNKLNESVFYN